MTRPEMQIKITTENNFFRNSVLPSAVTEWKKQDRNL